MTNELLWYLSIINMQKFKILLPKRDGLGILGAKMFHKLIWLSVYVHCAYSLININSYTVKNFAVHICLTYATKKDE